MSASDLETRQEIHQSNEAERGATSVDLRLEIKPVDPDFENKATIAEVFPCK